MPQSLAGQRSRSRAWSSGSESSTISMAPMPQPYMSQRKRLRASSSCSDSTPKSSAIRVARPKSPIVLIPLPRRAPLRETADGANTLKRRRTTTQIESEAHRRSATRPRSQRTPKSRLAPPVNSLKESGLVLPCVKVHVPAWKRLGLVLRPKKGQQGVLFPVARPTSFRGIHTIPNRGHISNTTTQDSVDGDGTTTPRSSGAESDPKGVAIDLINPTPKLPQDKELPPLPPVVSLDSEILGETELNASDQDSATIGDPAPKLRRRTNRVSYVMEPVSDDSDMGGDGGHASGRYASAVSDDESDFDEAASASSVTPSADGSSMVKDEQEVEAAEPIVQAARKPRPRVAASPLSNKRAGKGVDTSLPPLDNIDAIFADMASKALSLGLEEALSKIGKRAINIATMCSGTESPLVALDLLSEGLKQAGKPSISVNHQFSAEIDVVKQGYIERNFQPKKLFRDVREFIPEDATTATTAYGAKELIPGAIDILIAGFVCKDISRLNNHQKGLEDEGESGDTWSAIYSYTKRFRPSIVLIENVQATINFWNAFQSKWSAIGYDYAWVICDTKNYYIPQTRQRMYMIAIDKKQFGKGVKEALEQWKVLMIQLQRRCSSPFDAFLSCDTSDQYEHTSLAVDPNWALCKLRYDQIRSEQRLGIRRPITRWSENGTVRPPDFANRQWYHSQSSRVYDCIDIAHLQGVQKGYDSLYKMAIWDVSQNVDRFKASLGIVSCITPSGSNFVSNRHTALTGSQLLLLQGMPADKLLFAKETQKDRQDLAGNAMTTTVIGASLVAALITGGKAFRKATPHQSQQPILRQPTKLLVVKPRVVQKPLPTNPYELQLQDFIQDAWLSSRLCNCEGTKKISKSAIKVCNDCKHTACSDCAGNPVHSYSTTIEPTKRKLSPIDFERKWRPLLPSRLRFSTFPEAQSLETGYPKGQDWQAFASRIQEADIPSNYFSIHGFKRRDRSWSVMYESPEATLELIIADKVHWRLTIRCPSSEPGDSRLRKILAQPFALGLVNSSSNLFEPDWRIHIPESSTYSVSISGSQERTSAWRSRLGMPDYKDETVPLRLQIDNGTGRGDERLAGRYEHLPHCGTAKSSLYKAISPATDPVFLFLDQDPIGPNEQDAFVFSHGCERLPYGEARLTFGSIEPSWQPWDVVSGLSTQVKVTVPGKWVTQHATLEAASHSAEAFVPTAMALSSVRSGECSHALVLLDVKTNVALGTGRFKQFAWMLEQAKTLPSFGSWQRFHATCPQDECRCAPSAPRILWSVNDKEEVTAHEDRKAAAIFERTLKTRCGIFHIEPSQSSTGTRIQVGVNLASLIHRARSRLPGAQSSSWRLITNHIDPAPEKFPKLRLKSNAFDEPYTTSLGLQYTLGRAQLQSLGWMRAQESGRRLALVEVEEAIHSELGWRVEAKAESDMTVYGGVLADLPSFGKTVTTIALINRELEEVTTDRLLKQNRELTPQSRLVNIAATLVVSPPHIAKQWYSEFNSCLSKSTSYNIILIESFSDLERLSIQDMREARVIIVSWSVLADEAYISQLAQFSAMPLPASTKGRAYDAWLDFCSTQIHSQVEAFQKLSTSKFVAHTQSLIDKRLAHPDFKAKVPLKITHGSSYQSFSAMKIANAEKALKRNSLPHSARLADPSVPLFQMFNFNRIVVDEYHYLYDSKNSDNHPACAAIKRISATKRWILSGTPPLANFSDVNQIASFLGVNLGRNVYGDGNVTTALEKRLINEQTDVERFISRTETMSYQWHEARHKLAQDFLDHFVRRNEPTLQDIPCQEILHPVELGIAHRAVYLELSQHLISQRMQIKKHKSKSGSDRSDRLNTSLNNSATAEEALLNQALLYETHECESGLDLQINIRKRQRKEVEDELLSLLKELKKACLQRLNSPVEDYYLAFKRDIESGNIFGDEMVRQMARKLIEKVDKGAAISRARKRAPASKGITALKELASEVRATAHELTLQVRSKRFLDSIKGLLPIIAAGGDDSLCHTCSSSNCIGITNPAHLFLVSHCGHTACKACLEARTDSEACVHEGCEVPVQANNLIRVSDIGSPKADAPKKGFGEKLDGVSALIKQLPESDQGIVFVPNDKVRKIMENVLGHNRVSFHSLGTRKPGAGKILEDFKTNTSPKERKKVLILNLASESAAGANLVNANHVIFVSPLLAKSQHEYDAAMAQAIARSRRYRQGKKVHIYHFAALQTIDVDILEHHHKRFDTIHSPGSTLKSPRKSYRREKTKMVRSRKGLFALVPISLLADEKFCETIDVDMDLTNFTSLIMFSETFESGSDDDDDDDDRPCPAGVASNLIVST